MENHIDKENIILKSSKISTQENSKSSSRPNGFYFQQRRGSLDLRALSGIDLDRVVRDTDIDILQNHLENITFCNLRDDDLKYLTDPYVIKLFRVAQLIIEYLLYAQEELIISVSNYAKRYSSKKRNLEKKRNELAGLQETTRHLRTQVKSKREDIHTLERLLKDASHNNNNNNHNRDHEKARHHRHQQYSAVSSSDIPSTDQSPAFNANLEYYITGPSGLSVKFTNPITTPICEIISQAVSVFVSRKIPEFDPNLHLIYRGRVLLHQDKTSTLASNAICNGDTIVAIYHSNTLNSNDDGNADNDNGREAIRPRRRAKHSTAGVLSDDDNVDGSDGESHRRGTDSSRRREQALRASLTAVASSAPSSRPVLSDTVTDQNAAATQQMMAFVSQQQTCMSEMTNQLRQGMESALKSIEITQQQMQQQQLLANNNNNNAIYPGNSSANALVQTDMLFQMSERWKNLETSIRQKMEDQLMEYSKKLSKGTNQPRYLVGELEDDNDLEQDEQQARPINSTVPAEKIALVTASAAASASSQTGSKPQVVDERQPLISSATTPLIPVAASSSSSYSSSSSTALSDSKEANKSISLENKSQIPAQPLSSSTADMTRDRSATPAATAANLPPINKLDSGNVNLLFTTMTSPDLTQHGKESVLVTVPHNCSNMDDLIFFIRNSISEKINVPLARVTLIFKGKSVTLGLDVDKSFTALEAASLVDEGLLCVKINSGKVLTDAQLDVLVAEWEERVARGSHNLSCSSVNSSADLGRVSRQHHHQRRDATEQQRLNTLTRSINGSVRNSAVSSAQTSWDNNCGIRNSQDGDIYYSDHDDNDQEEDEEAEGAENVEEKKSNELSLGLLRSSLIASPAGLKKPASASSAHRQARKSLEAALIAVSDSDGLTDDEYHEKMTALKKISQAMPAQLSAHVESFRAGLPGVMVAAAADSESEGVGDDDLQGTVTSLSLTGSTALGLGRSRLNMGLSGSLVQHRTLRQGVGQSTDSLVRDSYDSQGQGHVSDTAMRRSAALTRSFDNDHDDGDDNCHDGDGGEDDNLEHTGYSSQLSTDQGGDSAFLPKKLNDRYEHSGDWDEDDQGSNISNSDVKTMGASKTQSQRKGYSSTDSSNIIAFKPQRDQSKGAQQFDSRVSSDWDRDSSDSIAAFADAKSGRGAQHSQSGAVSMDSLDQYEAKHAASSVASSVVQEFSELENTASYDGLDVQAIRKSEVLRRADELEREANKKSQREQAQSLAQQPPDTASLSSIHNDIHYSERHPPPLDPALMNTPRMKSHSGAAQAPSSVLSVASSVSPFQDMQSHHNYNNSNSADVKQRDAKLMRRSTPRDWDNDDDDSLGEDNLLNDGNNSLALSDSATTAGFDEMAYESFSNK